jgi:tetratricopeptide (TPR) repeat protein
MNNFYKSVLFVWGFGMLLFCAISCAKKAGIDHTFSAEQGIKRQIEYGETLFDKGKYDQAADIFKEILKYYPENVIAHYRLGVISGKQGLLQSGCDLFLARAPLFSPNGGG